MKQLFLLIMSVVMIYGCSDSGTDDNPSLKSNSVVTKISKYMTKNQTH